MTQQPKHRSGNRLRRHGLVDTECEQDRANGRRRRLQHHPLQHRREHASQRGIRRVRGHSVKQQHQGLVFATRSMKRHRQIDLRVGVTRPQRQRAFERRTRKRGMPERPMRVTQGIVELRSPCVPGDGTL